MARSKKEKELSLEQQAELTRAAQAADVKPSTEPSFWEVRALLSEKTSDGMRRKMYFKHHPNATYATGMDVAQWLDALYAKHSARLG